VALRDEGVYDLDRDPHELESRHGDPGYAGVRNDHAERLAHLPNCRGATCRSRPS
jgi:hypothetical protein